MWFVPLAGLGLLASVLAAPPPPVQAASVPAGIVTAGLIPGQRNIPGPVAVTRQVSFVGSVHADPSWQRFKSVRIPIGAQKGDLSVMVFTHSTAVTWGGPAASRPWRAVSSTTANGMVSTVYTKSLTPADLRTEVRFDAPKFSKAMLSVAVYAGLDRAARVSATASSDRGATRHLTPATVAGPGDWTLSYWVDHQRSTTAWRTSTATVRDTAIGTGGGRFSALLADSAGSNTGSHYGGRVGTTNAATDSVMWTVRITSGDTPPPPTSRVTKLLVVVEENRTTSAYNQMPYLSSLADTYGRATRFSGLVHPSAGNYLAMVSGRGTATCGLRDPLPALCLQGGPTVFGQALAAGYAAKTYAESMQTPCQETNSAFYAARHNPWTYYASEAAGCAAHDVNLGTTASGPLRSDIDAATLPNAGMLIPNLQNDAHDGTLGQADAWLSTWMPVIMRGPDYQSGRLAIVITFDEGVGSNQSIPFVLVQRSVSHRVVSSPYSHYGLSRFYSDVLGASPLGAAATEPGLGKAFGL